MTVQAVLTTGTVFPAAASPFGGSSDDRRPGRTPDRTPGDGSRGPLRRTLRGTLSTDARFRLRASLLLLPGASEWCLTGAEQVDAGLTRTDVVVDGFPRSAASWVRALLEQADPTLRVSSHAHTVRHVRRAVDRRIPTLVLVRRPGPAVASLVEHVPGLSPATGLDLWERYYDGVAELLEHVTLGTYAEAVTEPAAVLGRLDRRFGTRLAPARDLARPAEAARRTEDVQRAVGLAVPAAGSADAFGTDDWSDADLRRVERLDWTYRRLVAASYES